LEEGDMKRYLAIAVVVALGLIATGAVAKEAKQNQDMNGSKQLVYKVCEGKGAKWVGIVYSDEMNKDSMDAVSVICKNASGEYEVPNNDFGDRERVRIKCAPYEVIYGIAYKDREGKDEADGITLICKDTKNGETRIAFNADLQGGRDYVQITGDGAIGVAYNDRINDDAVDGVTLVTK
jgi:hypothetical protein